MDRLKESFPRCDINDLEDQLQKCYKGSHEKIQYIVDRNFELSKIKVIINYSLKAPIYCVCMALYIQHVIVSREWFIITKINDEIDIVFSHATFQFLTNVGKTFKELSSIVKGRGILISQVGLCTVTRWIKDKDPLNIYRYNDFFWNLFKFGSSPNRIRVFEYKELLEINGWCNIKIEPLAVLEEEYLDKIKPTLDKKFRDLDSSELQMLALMLMANKK